MSEPLAPSSATTSVQTIYRDQYQAPSFTTETVDLTFDLQEASTLVHARLSIQRNPQAGHDAHDLVLNGEELSLKEIKLNDAILPASAYQHTATHLVIKQVPEQFTLEITTEINPAKNTALSGLYRSKNTYCTQCEAEGFRRITFFQDRPDVLATYTTTIIADKAKYPMLLSNGNPVTHGDLPNNRHYVTWHDPFKKPSYLFALVAGDFDLLEDAFTTMSGRKITLRVYVEKGFGDQSQHAMYSIKQAMAWDETAYGREYDLDIYMIVAIADFNMGAMENKGLNIFNTKYVLAKPATATDDDYIHILSVVGHEYFHNWSGNRVTCRDWFQLSLKEGFTIFRDQSFTEDTLSRGVMRIKDVVALRETQFPEDASPLSHPVRPDSYIEINNFYTATVYNKGAEVLRMMQTIIGKPAFRAGTDLYFQRFDGQAVTIEDFVQTMEEVSGEDLQHFRLWYSQSGTPIVSVQEDYDANQKIYTLTFSQNCPATAGQNDKQAFYIPIRLALLDSNGAMLPLTMAGKALSEEAVIRFDQAAQTFQFNNVYEKPIPSLLRNFSAPVKLRFNYSDADLLFLSKYDTDPFNQWEANQNYALRIIKRLIQDYQNDQPLRLPTEFIDLYANILHQRSSDDLFTAELLQLPSEKYISEQMEVIDVDAIHTVREFIRHELAANLHAFFLNIYQSYAEVSFADEFNMQAVGARQLKNVCLSYLMLLQQYIELGIEQFEAALGKNMTDTIPALMSLINSQHSYRHTALQAYYECWQYDALALDKWLTVQALDMHPDALAKVKKLMRHPAFDIKNPNKVYALIGAFTHRNAANFHRRDGEGYAFLRETVAQLDKINPQIAARMVKPLTLLHRYDIERQNLMQEQLELLLADKRLSADVYELVSKSLNERSE